MSDYIIPLAWNQLDSIAEFVDQRLIRQGVPTILRLRTRLVLEECFSAAMASPGADAAQMRCSFPDPMTVLIQCRSAQPDFTLDWSDLKALDSAACTYGLKLALSEGTCQITVGQR